MASPSRRVLICEDDKDSAETLAEILRSRGYEVLVCTDGRTAVAQAAFWRPTAAIIDVGLPGITGYSVAQYIRGLPIGPDVLLVALTGYADVSDIEMARYAGFNWHLSKPAKPSVLLDVLENPARAPKVGDDAVALHPH